MTSPQPDAADADQGAQQTGPDQTPGPDPAEPTEPADDTDTAAARARREAKNLRTRLRDAEQLAAQQGAQLTAMREAEAVRIAGARLNNGRDLLDLAGITIDQLLNDQGTIDPDKINDAVDQLIKDRDYLARRRFGGSGDVGHKGGEPTHTSAWQRAFQREGVIR